MSETTKELWDREYRDFESAPALEEADKPPMYSLVRDPLGIVWRVNRTRCVIARLPHRVDELPKGYSNVARWSELVKKSAWIRRSDRSLFRYGYGPVKLIRRGRHDWLYESIR